MNDSDLDRINADKIYHDLELARIKDSILAKLSDEEISILNI